MRKPVTLVLLAGLVLAGCSTSDSEETGLLAALGRVAATAETRVAVEYGEPARVRALTDRDKDRYQSLQIYGYSTIAPYSLKIKDGLRLDVAGFDEAILVGSVPKQATVLRGTYDVAAVEGKLRDRGIDSEPGLGTTHWRSARDYEINLAEGPFNDIAPILGFNNIRTGPGAFAFAPAAAGIDWVTDPGDSTLADDDVLVPLARCLGDVIVAQLLATGEAVGVRDDATEVVCLKEDPSRVLAALRKDVPSTGQPWDEMLPGAKVDEDQGLARVTVPALKDKPAGLVLRLVLNHDLDALR